MLNGLVEDNVFTSTPWAQKPELQTERETILLDVIGAYDLSVQLPPTSRPAQKGANFSE
jgi:hypothetical protein